MATKESYDRKLSALFQELLQMGVLVEESLKITKDLFHSKDEEIFKKVLKFEEDINGLEISLEDKFITLIAIEHPVAHDLRKIVASLKIIASLERIGDYAVHVAKSLRALSETALAAFEPQIFSMLEGDIAMLDDSLTAFMRDDAEKAAETARRDDAVDREHDRLIGKLYSEDPVAHTAKEFASILFLGRYLERIGDHITNICEWIVYAGECKHVELND